MSLGSVLHDPQVVTRGNGIECVHVGRVSVEVDGDHSAGSRSYGRIDRFRVEAPRRRVDVGEDRLRARIAHGVGGRDVGQ